MASVIKTNSTRTSVRDTILQETASVGNPPRSAGVDDPLPYSTTRRQKYNTRWKQQKNLSIRQDLTFTQIFIIFTVLGIILMGIGFACRIYSSNYPKVIKYDYTDCIDNMTGNACSTTDANDRNTSPTEAAGSNNRTNTTVDTPRVCKCIWDVEIDDELSHRSDPVIFYYELENFSQNTRKYKKNVGWKQLKGELFKDGKPNMEESCNDSTENSTNIYPCGKIANSLFNDDFKMIDNREKDVLDSKGIAWESDLKKWFKNPPEDWNRVRTSFESPKDWHIDTIFEFYNGTHKGIENEHFIVWMRTAAFNTFRKKYAYIQNLEKAKYRIEINYRYQVKAFNGRKRIVIAADSKNYPMNTFFFYSYMIAGGICLLLGPIFLCIQVVMKAVHKRRLSSNKKNGDNEEALSANDDSAAALQLVDHDHPPEQQKAEKSLISRWFGC